MYSGVNLWWIELQNWLKTQTSSSVTIDLGWKKHLETLWNFNSGYFTLCFFVFVSVLLFHCCTVCTARKRKVYYSVDITTLVAFWHPIGRLLVINPFLPIEKNVSTFVASPMTRTSFFFSFVWCPYIARVRRIYCNKVNAKESLRDVHRTVSDEEKSRFIPMNFSISCTFS